MSDKYQRTNLSLLFSNVLEVTKLSLSSTKTSSLGIVSEFLLLLSNLLEDSLVGLADWLDGEETVHALERDGLGLWDEEVDEEDGQDHHGGEEKVDTAARRTHGQEHLRGETRDDEVPEPVVGSGRSLTKRSAEDKLAFVLKRGKIEVFLPGIVVEHLRVKDPRGTIPRGSIECSPEVEKEDSSDSSRAEVGILRIGGHIGCRDVSADNPHAARASQRTNHEQVATAQLINEDEEPNEGQDSLDNTKETCGEEAGVGSLDTDRLENGRAVVVDGVDTRAVLEQEQETTKNESPLNSSTATNCLEWLPEAGANTSLLLLDCCVDKGNLLDKVQIVDLEIADPAEVLEGLFAAILGEQPAGRLLEPEGAHKKEPSGYQLDREWYQPLPVTRGHRFAQSVVDPKPHETTLGSQNMLARVDDAMELTICHPSS